MDVAFQNWVIALSLGIVGGSLIGLVMGHKLKEPTARAIFSPMVFQSGSTNKVLVVIGFALIAFAFFAGILQGMHNRDDSIESFARACFNYALDTKIFRKILE